MKKLRQGEGSIQFHRTRRSFGHSVFRAMLVSGERDDGSPGKLTQEELAKRSGIARSTIAKYLAAKDDETIAVNPDLETLCRLAGALRVPPALLLMTPGDWSRLAQAAVFLAEAVRNERVQSVAAELAKSNGGAMARAQAGLKLAEWFGVYQAKAPGMLDGDKSPTRETIAAEVEVLRRQVRQGILATTALPPLRDLTPGHYAPLLSLCATLGATPTFELGNQHHGNAA